MGGKNGKFISAAVIVLFNPDDETHDNLKSIMSEIDRIYLVDNSIKENIEFSKYENVVYMPMYHNYGLCEGLNIGCRKAIEDGVKYLITFNQDTFCPKGTISTLIESLYKDDTICYGTNIKYIYRNRENKRIFSEENAYSTVDSEVPWVIMAGNAFSSQAYLSVGGYDKKLFIDHIDQDFCFRLNAANYKIKRLGNTFIYQELGNMSAVTILNKKIHISNLSPTRYYLVFRNEYYLRKKYKKNYDVYKTSLWKFSASVIFFEKNKIKKLKACIAGVLAAEKNNMENDFSEWVQNE